MAGGGGGGGGSDEGKTKSSDVIIEMARPRKAEAEEKVRRLHISETISKITNHNHPLKAAQEQEQVHVDHDLDVAFVSGGSESAGDTGSTADATGSSGAGDGDDEGGDTVDGGVVPHTSVEETKKMLADIQASALKQGPLLTV